MNGVLGHLLEVAARVLEAGGELPPVRVTCEPGGTLAPVTVSPADPYMAAAAQVEIVEAVAGVLGRLVNRVDAGDAAWHVAGRVDGTDVEAVAVLLTGAGFTPTARVSAVSTADHARLLRDLIDWSTTLDGLVQSLEVAEDVRTPGAGFGARLALPRDVDTTRVTDLIVPAHASRPAWSEYLGEGILPTGHTLTLTTP